MNMGAKEVVLIGATVIGLAVGANQALEPTTPKGIQQQRQEQSVGDLSDANDTTNDRSRDAGSDLVNAENDRRNGHYNPRPPEPSRPKIRIRLP